MNKNDAICLIHAYHFADLLIFSKHGESRKEAAGLLSTAGIDPEDPTQVDAAYTALVEELAEDILPSGYEKTHDYWGGLCFTHNPTWNAPCRNTVLAGESGRFECCASEAALREELAAA